MNKSVKSITLIELMVCLIIVATIVLSFYNLEIFSHGQLIDSERRAKVHNDLAYCLERMTKYVQQANGDISNPAIVLNATGFRVRVDLNTPQTPSNLGDDDWIVYWIDGNTLKTTCTGLSAACALFTPEDLSNKILANFNNSVLPATPTDGFYVWIDPLGNFVDVGLVGRYTPTMAPARLTNPQVAMKTKLICNSSSTN